MKLEFRAKLENYNGVKVYEINNEKDFGTLFNSLTNFINDAKPNEVIKFTMFDIRGKINMKHKDVSKPMNTTKKTVIPKTDNRSKYVDNLKDIKKFLKKRKGWIRASDMLASLYIPERSLFTHLKNARRDGSLKFRMVGSRYEYKV